MKIKAFVVKPYSKEESLLMSIVMFTIGIILLTNPEGVLEILAYALGGFLIIIGLIKFFLYKRLLKTGVAATSELVKAIIFVILGSVAIIFFQAIETTFRIGVAAFILYMSINRLIFAISTRKKFKPYPVVSIILSSVSIVFAVLLALIPGLSFSIIGLFIMIYSIMEMIGYIIYATKKGKDKKDINEAIIISEVSNKEEEK